MPTRKDEMVRVGPRGKLLVEDPNYNLPRSGEAGVEQFVAMADQGTTSFPEDLVRAVAARLRDDKPSSKEDKEQAKLRQQSDKDAEALIEAQQKRMDEAEGGAAIVASASSFAGERTDRPAAAPAQDIGDAASEEDASAQLKDEKAPEKAGSKNS